MILSQGSCRCLATGNWWKFTEIPVGTVLSPLESRLVTNSCWRLGSPVSRKRVEIHRDPQGTQFCTLGLYLPPSLRIFWRAVPSVENGVDAAEEAVRRDAAALEVCGRQLHPGVPPHRILGCRCHQIMITGDGPGREYGRGLAESVSRWPWNRGQDSTKTAPVRHRRLGSPHATKIGRNPPRFPTRQIRRVGYPTLPATSREDPFTYRMASRTRRMLAGEVRQLWKSAAVSCIQGFLRTGFSGVGATRSWSPAMGRAASSAWALWRASPCNPGTRARMRRRLLKVAIGVCRCRAPGNG